MLNATSRLVLFPGAPLLELPAEPLIEQLQQQRFVEAQPITSFGDGSYLVGERFFDAFLFLGCSPSIELTPTDGDTPFCYLQIESGDRCELVSGKNLKAVCKQCKRRFEQLDIESTQPIPTVRCSHCQTEYAADEIAWRKSAALSRVRISLWNIFEGEAVPSDQLLDLLFHHSGEKWSYAYIG